MQGGWWILNPSPLDSRGGSQNISHFVGSPRTLKTLKVTNNTNDGRHWSTNIFGFFVSGFCWSRSMDHQIPPRPAQWLIALFAEAVQGPLRGIPRPKLCHSRRLGPTLSCRCWLLGQDSDDTYTLALQSFCFFPLEESICVVHPWNQRIKYCMIKPQGCSNLLYTV